MLQKGHAAGIEIMRLIRMLEFRKGHRRIPIPIYFTFRSHAFALIKLECGAKQQMNQRRQTARTSSNYDYLLDLLNLVKSRSSWYLSPNINAWYVVRILLKVVAVNAAEVI